VADEPTKKEPPITAQMMVDLLGENDQFSEMVKGKQFAEVMQALVNWVANTFDSEWDKELVQIMVSSSSGTAIARCAMQKQSLVQHVPESELQHLVNMKPEKREP